MFKNIKVLFIGDSHTVGPFGIKLDELLRNNFYVETYGVCGAVGEWFFIGKETKCGYFFRDISGNIYKGLKTKTPDIKEIVYKLQPDFIIAEFGANYYYSDEAYILKDFNSLISFISSISKCFIISQPDSRKFRDKIEYINKLTLKANKNRCLFFDSSSVTNYPDEGGDGIHYSINFLKNQAEN